MFTQVLGNNEKTIKATAFATLHKRKKYSNMQKPITG